MKHKLIPLTLTVSFFWTGATHAQSHAVEPASEASANISTPLAKSNLLQDWQLGGVTSHGSYREPGYMQLQGSRVGIWAARPLADRGHWQPTFQGQLQSSAMHYSSPISGELANVPDHELDLRLTALHPLSSAIASPWGYLLAGGYLGVGYRLHYNDLRGYTTKGNIGYRRLNQRLYLPLGIQLQTQSANPISFSMEFAPALYGNHTTFMTDIGGTQDATVKQKSQGFALQASWQPKPGWHLTAYHRQWSTRATSSWKTTINGVTESYVEPASEWKDTGIKLGRQF